VFTNFSSQELNLIPKKIPIEIKTLTPRCKIELIGCNIHLCCASSSTRTLKSGILITHHIQGAVLPSAAASRPSFSLSAATKGPQRQDLIIFLLCANLLQPCRRSSPIAAASASLNFGDTEEMTRDEEEKKGRDAEDMDP
jgi:hypothetical protein